MIISVIIGLLLFALTAYAFIKAFMPMINKMDDNAKKREERTEKQLKEALNIVNKYKEA